MHARRRLGQLRIDRRGKRVHQFRLLLIADPERRAAVLAVMPVGRAFMAVDRRIPYPERASAFHSKSGGNPHDIDRVSTATRALAADRAIAALIRVRRVAVDAEADRAAATGTFETHRHVSLLGALPRETQAMPIRLSWRYLTRLWPPAGGARGSNVEWLWISW